MEDGQHTHNLAPEGDSNGGSNGKAKIGRILEQKRKEKGLSLEEVEQATKIRKRYLDGLERDDYGVLPAGVYAQGFLKTYANYLGLNGEELSRQLKSRRMPQRERGIDYKTGPENGFEEPLIAPSGLQGTGKRRFPTSAIVTLLVAVLVLAVVIGALYYVGRGVEASRSGKEDPPPAQPADNPQKKDPQNKDPEKKVASKQEAQGTGAQADGTEQSKEKAAGEGTQRAGQGAPPEKLTVAVDVSERPSWLLIRADGVVVYAQVAQPGYSQTFEADRRLYIQGGDAGAVSVEINGQDAGPLGEPYTVGEKYFTLKNAS
jgi:cytoskeleton protein RodZ